MAKWSKKYTALEKVNGGNEYETGDHITKETVNVALNNTAYLQQTKVTAEANKGLITQRFLNGVDLNTILVNGFYGCNGACTNKPNEDGPGQMLVINRGDNWIGQFYINMNQNSQGASNRVHTRGYDNSKKVWSPWKQIDNDPSLYNLGAYDTYVDNGDGTTTITRQTGYKTYYGTEDEKWRIINDYFYATDNSIKAYGTFSDDTYGEAQQKNSYGFATVIPSAFNNSSITNKISFGNNGINFGLKISGVTTLNSFKEYLGKKPISIEYKLATSYTETIITGLPQITLDKQGCEWLRGEWEKGLNLINIKNISNNGIIYPNLPAGTYTFSLKTTGTGDGFNLKINSLSGDTIGSAGIKNGYGVVTFTVTSVVDLYFNGWGNTWTNYDIMLVKGFVPYPYQPYNSAYHITNNQADLLSNEEELSRNLFNVPDESQTSKGVTKNIINNEIALHGTTTDKEAAGKFELYLEPGTYTFSNKIISGSGDTMRLVFHDINWSWQKTMLLGDNGSTATITNTERRVICEYYQDDNRSYNLLTLAIMLNKGSEPLPYAPYNGSIVHEKQLSLQAPSMGSQVANECMMNVTGEYYNNSSSDIYILLGNIKPSYKEARDGGFIINGTIGQYYYTQQAQINAVAYWRDKAKWKGSYTQDNSDGSFNNIVDLIITTTYKIYLVIKAGQFGQYNLQLQGVTIQYTGNILTAKEGSTASTFSQSDAIDLTALDTGLSDKLKFIDNNAITDPDGDGNYKIDNNYIYDEELATNDVDYTPFDGISSYDSQSGINQDFYKQIKTNKENINSLRGRSLYVNTITMLFTSPDKAVVTLTILDTLPHDDPSSGTSWSFVRDYLNNKGYVLGSYTNWQETNKVYPCSGSINISSSVQFPIVGISKDSATNGLFWLHCLAYDGSPVSIAFSTVINSRALSIQIF